MFPSPFLNIYSAYLISDSLLVFLIYFTISIYFVLDSCFLGFLSYVIFIILVLQFVSLILRFNFSAHHYFKFMRMCVCMCIWMMVSSFINCQCSSESVVNQGKETVHSCKWWMPCVTFCSIFVHNAFALAI